MNAKSIIKIGDVFNYLTVISEHGRNKRQNIIWLCKCKCGKETHVITAELISGSTKSCGCLRIEKIVSIRFKHGKSKTVEYGIWNGIIKRIENINCDGYLDYGGRGISICKEWRESFECFLNDMGQRPSKEHSIDRIDNDGDYCPDNCRWVTQDIQRRNKRNNIYIEYNGIVKILEDWAKELNVTRSKFKEIIKKDKQFKTLTK